MLINDTMWLLLEKWYDSRTQNVIDVTLSRQVSVNNNQRCPLLPTDPSPRHDTPSTKQDGPLNATGRCSFYPSAVNTPSSIKQTVPAFTNKDYPLPITLLVSVLCGVYKHIPNRHCLSTNSITYILYIVSGVGRCQKVGVGWGTQTRNLSTFDKEPI